MVRFLLRRLVGSAGILVALSLLAYVLFYLAPGDPAAVIVAQQIGRLPTSEEIAAARAEYGLDQPLLVQ